MKSSIGIIGGGFSGCMLAHHLLEKTENFQVVIFNKSNRIGPGLAYEPQSSTMLLNVKAGKMSAFPAIPSDFVDWLIKENIFPFKTSDEIADSFVSRELYGYYLDHIWQNILQKHGARITEVINEVITISHRIDTFTIETKTKEYEVQYCVLATGNEKPRNPLLSDTAFISSQNYHQNPWAIPIEKIHNTRPILIIGTGLTMVDTIQLLRKNLKNGIVYCISPHGFKILAHENSIISYDDILEKIQLSGRLADLLAQFNTAKKEIKKRKGTLDALINYFRPITGIIWQGFTPYEKNFFLEHLRHKWGVARHRIPPISFQQINKEIQDKKLNINAGKIKEIIENKSGLNVRYFDNAQNKELLLTVSCIINCTGPESDVSKMKHGLLLNLLKKSIIAPGPSNLGVQVSVNDMRIKNTHNITKLYAIGNLLRGELWESTAVNELRSQTEILAQEIICTEKMEKKC